MITRMDAPDPRENPFLVGQDAAEARLSDALRGGRMHHAWLMTGPPGVGKATLAYRFARRLLGDDAAAGDPSHKVFRRTAAGAHADLHTVGRTINPTTKKLRGEIVVDDVRAAGDFLRLTPAEAGWRVVIVDRADELNRNAANALLKILEEPPPRAVLLLVCGTPGALPPTVRSRCCRLPLPPLGEADMDQALARYLPSMATDERARLASVSDGSPGRALMLAGEAGLAMASLVDDVLADLPRLSAGKAYAVADQLGRAEGAFAVFMDLLRAKLADAVRQTVRGGGAALQRRIAAVRTPEAWVAIWQALGRLQDDTVRFNLDKRQALIQGLMLIAPSSEMQ
jgi:DNA polymerase-3 subunit delta'